MTFRSPPGLGAAPQVPAELESTIDATATSAAVELFAAYRVTLAPVTGSEVQLPIPDLSALGIVRFTASGLVVARPTGSGVYDRFRARITFPIRAVSERVVGFGGRLIAAGEPKYMNSPETPVYTKGRHLFGLDRAKSSLHRSGRAVLVEGYLDAISLHAQTYARRLYLDAGYEERGPEFVEEGIEHVAMGKRLQPTRARR